MKNVKIATVALLMWVVATGCGNLLDADYQENLAAAEVHFQQGFEGYWVSVELDGEVRFQDRLDSAVPFAGPLAVFRLDVPRGTHQLLIRWVPTDGDCRAHISTVDLRLDQTEFYYVGLIASEGSMQAIVQESPFLYI